MRPRIDPGVTTLLLLVLSSAAAAAPAEIETRVDAAQVSWGQNVTLQLRLRGAAIESQPDLTPLESAFDVIDVSRSRRQSLVNGVHDASSDWEITLLPKTTGTLEIPALPVGRARSAPQSVRVLAASQGTPPARDEVLSSSASAPVSMRVVAERLNPYEQERVLLHVRLYAGPELIEGSIADPDIAGATVERLGEDRPFREEVSGRAYRGVERTYAVLPEAPGKLTVPPVAFEGLVRDQRQPTPRRRTGFFSGSLMNDLLSGRGLADDFFASFPGRARRRMVVRSEPLTLEVRPRPEASKPAWWLPARAVSLTESWEPDPGQARVGQVLTRRITLRAEGAGTSQLPVLDSAERKGAKLYAEPPETTETQAGSARVQEFTVIPTQPGRLELPPMEVAWWDTVSESPRIASLEARTIEVQPGEAGETSPTHRSAVPAQVASVAATTPEPAAPGANDSIPVALLWAAGLTLPGVIAAAAWYTRAQRGEDPPGDRRPAERALRRACRRSDPVAAERALHRILRVVDRGRARSDLEPWAREVGGENLAREVARLLSVRYSNHPREWQGGGLWSAYRSTRKRREGSGPRPRGGLPPLYPAPGSEGSARTAI